MSQRLLSDVRNLLDRAQAAFAAAGDQSGSMTLAAVSARLEEPLRVAIAGKVKAGKSTLLNALVGEELAPTDAGECTQIVTWYKDGHTYLTTLHLEGGQSEQTSFTRDLGAIEVDLKGRDPDDVAWIEVAWPSTRLRDITLIDTPGLGSVNVEVSARAQRFLTMGDDAEGAPAEADAVIYLMRHLHQADLGFLEAFHDDAFGLANPINTVAVLSRADEVGACRVEAMTSASQIAGTYGADPRIRRLCQTVVPVAGLVAQASVTLTEVEFRSLRALAALPPGQLDALLLSVDRFTADEPLVELAPIEREDLLKRLGLYGARVAVGLVQDGRAETARELGEELRRISGIDELRSLLTSMFSQRRDVLKAHAALAALEETLNSHAGSESESLLAELERITAGAHEFNEVQLLNSIRSGSLDFKPDEVEEIEQLLGSSPREAEPAGLDPETQRAALVDAVTRWKRRAENSLTPKPLADASNIVVRSYEGRLASLTS